MRQKEPLFLPSSQMSAADEEVLRATGLGVESMDAHELADLLEGEGEEVDFSFASQRANEMQVDEQDSFELVEEGGLSATQSSHNEDKVCSSLSLFVASKHSHLQTFQPLFED